MVMRRYVYRFIISVIVFCSIIPAQATAPVWTFTPLTATSASVPSNSAATIKYLVTNQSSKPHTLVMSPMPGIAQVTIGTGVCGNPFVLSTKGSSCTLILEANGSQLTQPINDGPIVCQQGSADQCYRPSQMDVLQITQAPAIPLPGDCTNTSNNNVACQITIASQTNYGFTNMTYALCRSAQCDYNGVQTDVTCSCDLINDYQGIYSASVSPLDYNASKPVGNTVKSTYSRVNSSGETPTDCPSGPFANCFGATCTVSGSTVTCTCPVDTDTYIAPESNCTLGSNKIWSATSVSSFPSIDGSMEYIYDTFFDGNSP